MYKIQRLNDIKKNYKMKKKHLTNNNTMVRNSYINKTNDYKKVQKDYDKNLRRQLKKKNYFQTDIS